MHVMQVAGAEVLVTQIIEQLADKINPTVFCLDALGTLGEKLRDQGIPVVVLDRQPGLDFKVAKKLANAAKDREIHVLHAHQYSIFLLALSRILCGNRSKILFTEHGRHYPDIVSRKRRFANRWVLQKYAEISTACCDFSTEPLRANEVALSVLFTLRNGVDLQSLSPKGDHANVRALRKKLGLKPDIPYAACIARFHPVKDHQTLIRA